MRFKPRPEVWSKKEKKRNFELTPKYDWSFEGVIEFMNATMDAKYVKLDSSLVKCFHVVKYFFRFGILCSS